MGEAGDLSAPEVGKIRWPWCLSEQVRVCNGYPRQPSRRQRVCGDRVKTVVDRAQTRRGGEEKRSLCTLLM